MSPQMVLTGALLGFLSGLFGVGGSSIATPLLRLLNVPRLTALATPLPVALPTALVGGYLYWRRGLVNTRAALWTALGGVPAAVLGAYLTAFLPGRLLMLLTGLFVLAVGVRLVRTPPAPEIRETLPASALRLLALGAGIGFLSGLLANGGGFLLVPAYIMLFRMTPREAAATSLVAVALLALPGTWVHWRLGHVDPGIAASLAVGVLPATYLGARVGLSLDPRTSRWLFGCFLLLFGLLFVARTIYRAELYGWLS